MIDQLLTPPVLSLWQWRAALALILVAYLGLLYGICAINRRRLR